MQPNPTCTLALCTLFLLLRSQGAAATREPTSTKKIIATCTSVLLQQIQFLKVKGELGLFFLSAPEFQSRTNHDFVEVFAVLLLLLLLRNRFVCGVAKLQQFCYVLAL
jgi:hypothetical protein